MLKIGKLIGSAVSIPVLGTVSLTCMCALPEGDNNQSFFLSSVTSLKASKNLTFSSFLFFDMILAISLTANSSRFRSRGIIPDPTSTASKSRKENPQKLTQLSSRSHPRHLVGKWTAQKDITIDTTSDSQVNSNFPNRWSPASLTFNNYFYLFLYLYIT